MTGLFSPLFASAKAPLTVKVTVSLPTRPFTEAVVVSVVAVVFPSYSLSAAVTPVMVMDFLLIVAVAVD